VTAAVEVFASMHPPETWPQAINIWRESARTNWENFVHFRDAPETHDSDHLYRTGFWADMARMSYGDAAELLDMYLQRQREAPRPAAPQQRP
jgi:hypothetical protein